MYTVKVLATGSFDSVDISSALREIADKIADPRSYKSNDNNIVVNIKWEGDGDNSAEEAEAIFEEAM